MARTHLIAASCVLGIALLLAPWAFEARAQVANAGNSSASDVSTSGSATRALAALDAIGAQEWLTQSSGVLLARVIAASSKADLDEAAKADARAQALVATGYLSGSNGYTQSKADAIRFLRLGAASNAIAQTNLGVMLDDGRATSDGRPARAEAARLFRAAAVQGHPIAQVRLGLYFRRGTVVQQDDKEAARLFKLAADQGNAQAQCELGRVLQSHGNLKDGARFLQAAAAQGYADAIYEVALNARFDYEHEILGSRAIQLHINDMVVDSPIANTAEDLLEWDKQYRAAGSERAELAKAGTAPPFFADAIKAYERDAAKGIASAELALGTMHFHGVGFTKDEAAAYADFLKAGQLGNIVAMLDVGIMAELGRGVAKDEAKAVAVYKVLANFGDADGQINLAHMTDKGLGGLTADHAAAVGLYKLAAKQGAHSAQAKLKELGETW